MSWWCFRCQAREFGGGGGLLNPMETTVPIYSAMGVSFVWPMAYIVFSSRGKERLYLGEDETWWKDREQAKVFSTEREAGLAVKRSEVATGYQPVKSASTD